MIDYLEQLFVRREYMEAGEGDAVPSPFRKEAGEPEPVQGLPVSRFRDESEWQQEATRRIERVLTMPDTPARRLPGENTDELPRPFLSREEPGSETYPTPFVNRDDGRGRGEELEHRLRRNSRRYDSGFFLY